MFFRRSTILLASTLISLLAISRAQAADPPRQHLLLDQNWRFYLGDAPDVGTSLDYAEPTDLTKLFKPDLANLAAIEKSQDAASKQNGEQLHFVQSTFDASAWRSLDLPHDWAVELPFAPTADFQHGFKDLYTKKNTTVGWYRRTFALPASDKGRTLSIDFDGIYRNSLVWLNGRLLGRHPSGYTSFEYDITEFANTGDGRDGENTLVVRVDASRFEGWFYEGAGIYRHVWLNKLSPVHVAHWGTYITTAIAQPDSADHIITARIDLQNDSPSSQKLSLTSEIFDAARKSLATLYTADIQLDSSSHKPITHKITIHAPNLWSPETPYLYTLVTTLESPDGTLFDRVETPFGVRTITWDAQKGFTLNGKAYTIKGTCNHQDHAGVGTAIPDALQYWRIAKLKEMGANAYRTSHNAPTPELLDACDKLGMLVLDETRRPGSDREALAQLTALIQRDKNHPCVFAWSLSNEEGRDNIQGDDQIGTPIAKAMLDLAHSLDPSRQCTFAMNAGWGTGFDTVTEILGYNYATNRRAPISSDERHAKFPDKPSIGTEEASTRTTRGNYAEDREGNISSRSLNRGTITDPKLKALGFVSAYDLEGVPAERWWNYYVARPFMSGGFVWTGFDYRGEPTPYRWPCTTSHFGILDLCGFPKDNFWYYQAWWTDKPVLHVYPHWNWPGKEGKTIDVWVQSNCDEVELILNGESLGRKKVTPRQHLEWTVKYVPGTLLAKGFKAGTQILTDQVETTSAAAGLTFTTDRAQISADGEDVTLITVSAIDARGRRVPTADNKITFRLSGPARIIGVGNGNPSSHESDKVPARTLFNGLAQVIIQSNRSAGLVELTATSENLRPAAMQITVKPAIQRAVLP
jgi:beta-galactosidase